MPLKRSKTAQDRFRPLPYTMTFKKIDWSFYAFSRVYHNKAGTGFAMRARMLAHTTLGRKTLLNWSVIYPYGLQGQKISSQFIPSIHNNPGPERKQIMHFNRNMLPILGVTWHSFANEREATRFANWAEKVTRLHQYPCEAYVWRDDDRPAAEQWQVKVVNW